MTVHEEPPEDVDWSTLSYADDPRLAFDRLRERCPVARSRADGSWMITGYDEVRACALDADALSNRVSKRVQIPNGLDGAEHRRFRSFVDRFFEPARVHALRTTFRAIADDVIRGLPRKSAVDAVWQIGAPLSVRFQCAWLGWPRELEPMLLDWMWDHRAAMRGSDPSQRAAVANRFDELVAEQLRRHKQTRSPDLTSELQEVMVEDPRVEGGRRILTPAELVSVLRNWTAGDLGTIASCFGVVALRVATDHALQSSLRAAAGDSALIDDAIDECLRMDDPFLWNRRVVLRDLQLAGRNIPAGAKLILNWTAANRDPRRFAGPDDFRPRHNAAHNLVYGIGQHVCPGRGLATLQLREALTALLDCENALRVAPRPPVRASAPMGGFDHVWLLLD